MLAEGKDPLEYPGMTFVGTPEESMALNDTPGPMIIIAASGMCEGGRVLHHLKHCVQDEDNIILICGFQAENTLGRRIVERRETIKVFGEEVPLRAKVEIINALSAHADRWRARESVGDGGHTQGAGHTQRRRADARADLPI